jgi:putative acetyltransferase
MASREELLRDDYAIRDIEPRDVAGVARLIRSVMPEFGACGAGFAINDPEVDDMYTAYTSHGVKAAYWIVGRVASGEVAGGGGFAPLAGGDGSTCELRKMYFVPELRGLGFGKEMLARCVDGARKAGFLQMYLETLSSMTTARALYEKHGFKKLSCAIGATGHFSCDSFYALELKA